MGVERALDNLPHDCFRQSLEVGKGRRTLQLSRAVTHGKSLETTLAAGKRAPEVLSAAQASLSCDGYSFSRLKMLSGMERMMNMMSAHFAGT